MSPKRWDPSKQVVQALSTINFGKWVALKKDWSFLRETPHWGSVGWTAFWRYWNLSISWKAKGFVLGPFSQLKFVELYLMLSDRTWAWFPFWLMAWSQTGTVGHNSCATLPTPQDREHVCETLFLSVLEQQWITRALWGATLIFPVWSAGKQVPWSNRPCRHAAGSTAHPRALGEQLAADSVPTPSKRHVGRASEECWVHSL